MTQVTFPEVHEMIATIATKIAMEQTDYSSFKRWATLANDESFLATTARFYLFCKERNYNLINVKSNGI
jgi:hypothetical protein